MVGCGKVQLFRVWCSAISIVFLSARHAHSFFYWTVSNLYVPMIFIKSAAELACIATWSQPCIYYARSLKKNWFISVWREIVITFSVFRCLHWENTLLKQLDILQNIKYAVLVDSVFESENNYMSCSVSARKTYPFVRWSFGKILVWKDRLLVALTTILKLERRNMFLQI